ncbi:MAG: hypothetical protein DWQ07_14395 [Chloroflexi bacterium]|nr:MAG: hypothetical protein DWQ07_14395 [Chloroflexota bacterium]MBL1195727.1 hypothetical protein [Chloroflexota bacterium]NOH13015.1 NTP transferase domain-containing protein [Chloroflexota bacterium]
MQAIVTAGGIPEPEEPLYEFSQGASKALIEIAGKTMIQWVLDALSGSKHIENVVIVGLDESSGVTCEKPLAFTPNHGGMLDNIQAGTRKALEVQPDAKYVLMVSSDIPSITPEIVDWTIERALETEEDIYYNVVTRDVMEARFPGSNRTYLRLRESEVCGGDMNVVATDTVTSNDEFWTKMMYARKSIIRQAALIGFDTLFLMLIRRLTLPDAVKRVSKKIGLKARAVESPYAEIAMDVDKTYQLEMLAKDLEQRAAV